MVAAIGATSSTGVGGTDNARGCAYRCSGSAATDDRGKRAATPAPNPWSLAAAGDTHVRGHDPSHDLSSDDEADDIDDFESWMASVR